MKSRAYLGEFELLVVAAVARLGTDAYGVVLRQEIQDRTGRDVSIGTLYKALTRLEAKGLVASHKGDPTPVRGGRAKTYFTIEAAGLEALKTSMRNLGRLLDGVDLEALS